MYNFITLRFMRDENRKTLYMTTAIAVLHSTALLIGYYLLNK